MTVGFGRSFGAALVGIVTAQAAYADLTAEDVWNDWKSYMTGFGYEVTGSEARSGSMLTVRDVSMSTEVDDPATTFAMSAEELTFTEQGDGTVLVGFPNVMPMTFSGNDPISGEFAGSIDYTQTGPAMRVSGDPNNIVYDYTATEIAMVLTSLTADGTELPPDAARFTVRAANIASSATMVVGELRGLEQSMSADSLTYDFAFADPETGETVALSGEAENMTFEGGGNIPTTLDPSDVRAMLDAGFEIDGGFSFGAGRSNMEAMAEGDEFAAASSSEGGRFRVAINSEALVYDLGQRGLDLTVNVSDLPFPLALSMSESGFLLTLPIAMSDEPQDFALAMKMGDFTLSELIWSMFDPGSVLPRDPANLELDLTGQATLATDFLDPQFATSPEAMQTPPGELNALSIRTLLLSLAGAELTGSGDFTFDKSGAASFNGMPAPRGALDLMLVGGNGLVDRLVQMGVLPEEQAMGARMMMGMLAVPGDAPDTLISKIEINDEGHILANGQRIQ